MSTLTGISSYSSAASYLFSKIDTSNKGYINEEDLVSAFSSLTSTSDTSASDVFSQLDSDSDGKITESEFSSALEALNARVARNAKQGEISGTPTFVFNGKKVKEGEMTAAELDAAVAAASKR